MVVFVTSTITLADNTKSSAVLDRVDGMYRCAVEGKMNCWRGVHPSEGFIMDESDTR